MPPLWLLQLGSPGLVLSGGCLSSRAIGTNSENGTRRCSRAPDAVLLGCNPSIVRALGVDFCCAPVTTACNPPAAQGLTGSPAVAAPSAPAGPAVCTDYLTSLVSAYCLSLHCTCLGL